MLVAVVCIALLTASSATAQAPAPTDAAWMHRPGLLMGQPGMPNPVADAPTVLGLGGLRIHMKLAEVTAVAPGLQPVKGDAWRRVGKAANPVELQQSIVLGGCVYDEHVLADDTGVTDIVLRLRKGDVEACREEAVGALTTRYGPAAAQKAAAPFEPMSHWSWTGLILHQEALSAGVTWSHGARSGAGDLRVSVMDSERSGFTIQ